MIWLRALSFMLLVQATVVGIVPWLLGRVGPRLELGPWRAAGWIPLGLGVSLLLMCNAVFVRQGHGTAAPYDPPRALVVQGPYRYVRNPMYLSATLIVVGLGLWTRAVSLFGYAMLLTGAYHVFVRHYEEPRLAALFGPSYQTYLRTVPRWWPRVANAARGERPRRDTVPPG